MTRSTKKWCAALLPGLTLGGLVACGGGETGTEPSAAPRPEFDGAVPQSPVRSEPSTAPVPLPKAPPTALGTRDGGEDPSPRCIPVAGPDEPDDDFKDQNCDGIDGDVARAVFVSPTGDDARSGTMGEPLLTLARAVVVASAAAKSVYVCDGTYEENLKLDGVSVSFYGGYDCENGWRRHLYRAVVSPKSGAPLVVDGAPSEVVFDRFAFRAADATVASESSIAASVNRSMGVRFVHVELSAGSGADGVDGVHAKDDPPAAPTALSGHDVRDAAICRTSAKGGGPSAASSPGCGVVAEGGKGDYLICPDGSLVLGGTGGKGGNFALGLAPELGVNGLPTAFESLNGTAGRAGANGAVGSSFGSLEGGHYRATNAGAKGRQGHPGTAGRGGSGGDSSEHGPSPDYAYAVGAGGGQGGYPGCGGEGGGAGLPGGGSIALVMEGSSVWMTHSTLLTSGGGRGGNGGEGAVGALGTTGASGGHAVRPDADGKPGGRGGDGGNGGSGGPGGGGPSVGIAFRGKAPHLGAVSFSLGTPGLGGTSSATKGEDGISTEMWGLDAEGDAGTDAGAP